MNGSKTLPNYYNKFIIYIIKMPEQKIRVCKIPAGGDPYCIYVVPRTQQCGVVTSPYHINTCKQKKDNKKY